MMILSIIVNKLFLTKLIKSFNILLGVIYYNLYVLLISVFTVNQRYTFLIGLLDEPLFIDILILLITFI